jgi:hypothetical protein
MGTHKSSLNSVSQNEPMEVLLSSVCQMYQPTEVVNFHEQDQMPTKVAEIIPPPLALSQSNLAKSHTAPPSASRASPQDRQRQPSTPPPPATTRPPARTTRSPGRSPAPPPIPAARPPPPWMPLRLACAGVGTVTRPRHHTC